MEQPCLACTTPPTWSVPAREPGFVNQAWELVLQQPADLVHLSKPRLPAVVFGLLYKLLWGAAVLTLVTGYDYLVAGLRYINETNNAPAAKRPAASEAVDGDKGGNA